MHNDNSAKTPTLRFPEFFDKWEEKKLGEVFQRVSRKNKENNLNVLTISAQQGLVNQEEYFLRSVSAKDVTGYYLLHKGEFAYNKSYSKGYPMGAIKRLNKYPKGAVSTLYICFDLIDKANNGEFFEQYLDDGNINYEIGKVAQEGARNHGLLNITANDFFEQIKIKFPKPPEQQKIASFLTTIDDWIENLKKQKEAQEKYKKGMMQKIFSQEIRFKNENGENYPEWEEKRLGELLEYEQPTKYLVSNTEYIDENNTPVVTAGKTFILGYTHESDGIFKDELPVIIFDDFTTASQFVNFPFKAKSSAMKILKPIGRNNIKFLFEALRNVKFEVGGHGRHWISVFSSMNVLIPTVAEQEKIADFLSSIDDLINLTNQRITQGEKWKKGVMQRMFV